MRRILRPILFTFALFLISCNASNNDNIQLEAEPIATPSSTKEAATQETEISVIPSTKENEFKIDDNIQLEAEPIATPSSTKETITQETEIFVIPSTKENEFKIDDNIQLEVEPIAAPTYTKGVITRKGFESVMFGMTDAEVRTAFKGNLKKQYDPDYPDCYYLGDENENIFFMIHAGIFQRIDVIDSPDIKIMGGAAIGMSFEAVEKLYPNAYRKPNFYTFPTEDLIVQLDENVKIIFEQGADEIVGNFIIGVPPSINFVEGCL